MNQDARIDEVLALVMELARGNLEARLETANRSEPLDGVIEGLNMLAEELSASAAELKRSEESFRSLIERSPDAILVHREETIVYVNPAALTLLGYQHASELTGCSTRPLLQLDEDPQATKRLELVRGSTPPTAREGRLLHRQGSPLEVEVVSLAVTFDGQPATLTIAREISARKHLTAKMMEMDRMIAVGTLAAGVGHEINNPLAYTISNLDYAIDALSTSARSGAGPSEQLKDARLREALLEAREGAERVRRIVCDLRTFSSTHEQTETAFELVPVLESAIQMAFNEIRHRARLLRDYCHVPMLVGSSSRLGQVFLNLLVNAAHAIPVGSASEHQIKVATVHADGQVQIEVSDTGVGIEPHHLARLFDPFFTTKPVGQGTGLGLFICKRIVAEHGGTLEVESRPGVGSTFRVILPTLRASDTPRARPHSVPTSEARRARVLVIDDEPGVGRGLVRVLGCDHEVSALTDAREALGCLLADDRYDVVLCDLMMPEMTGVELYAELEQHKPDLARRVLFLTGGAFTASTQAFVQRMADRCLDKPIDLHELRRKLGELCTTARLGTPEGRESRLVLGKLGEAAGARREGARAARRQP